METGLTQEKMNRVAILLCISVLFAVICGLLALVILPQSQAKGKKQRIICRDNLYQIQFAYRIWSGHNNDNYPWQLSVTSGGTMELCDLDATGFDKNGAVHFQVASNELNTPTILVCPADSEHLAAENFAGLKAGNVSYQIRTGKDIDDAHPREILALCPIHEIIVYCDGTVVKAITKQ